MNTGKKALILGLVLPFMMAVSVDADNEGETRPVRKPAFAADPVDKLGVGSLSIIGSAGKQTLRYTVRAQCEPLRAPVTGSYRVGRSSASITGDYGTIVLTNFLPDKTKALKKKITAGELIGWIYRDITIRSYDKSRQQTDASRFLTNRMWRDLGSRVVVVRADTER